MDKVFLEIAGRKIQNFKSYTIDADMFIPDDAFSIELARPEISIPAGKQCKLWVNDKLELTGIIDKVVPSYDKSGRKLSITGRDLMGWCVDADAEDFITVKNYTLKALAEKLLSKCEFIDIKNIQYQENVKGRLKSRGARSQVGLFDTTTPLSQIEPGMKVYEVLKEYSRSKGLLFYAMPDGSFVFGRPKENTGFSQFNIIHRKDGRGNNVLSGEKTDDISKGYSKVTVVGQKQGQDVFTAAQINVEAVKTDSAFPFYKPRFIKDEYGGYNPALQARLELEKMRHDRFRLQYTVQGHSQDRKNWSINELCTVMDEDPDFALKGVYLIYGRTFEKSKERGTITRLRLGLPGMIA